MNGSIPPAREAVTYGLAAATALLTEHMALWHPDVRLEREHAYVLGTVTLGTVFTAWCLRHDQTRAAAAWWLIATIGGAPVLAAYSLRRWLAAHDRDAFQAGRVFGEAQRDAAATRER